MLLLVATVRDGTDGDDARLRAADDDKDDAADDGGLGYAVGRGDDARVKREWTREGGAAEGEEGRSV